MGKDKVIYLIEDDQYRIKYVQNLIVLQYVHDNSSDEKCIDTGTEYLITQPKNPVPIPEEAVIERDISLPNFYNKNKQIKLTKDEIVSYILIKNNNALLVDSYGEKIAWIPKTSIVTAEQFSPLKKWRGSSKIAYCTDAICEGRGNALVFKKNGTYYEPSYSKNNGHLYGYKNLVWARIENEKQFGLQLFKRFPKNQLCAILDDKYENGEVVLSSATSDLIKGCI